MSFDYYGNCKECGNKVHPELTHCPICDEHERNPPKTRKMDDGCVHYEGLTEKAIEVVPALKELEFDYVKEMIESFWYHKIHLGGDFYTPGTYDMSKYLHHFPMPEDMSGKSVIELGAADGFFSFEMKRRGADEVWAFDISSIAVEHMRFLRHLGFGNIYEIEHDILKTKITGKFDYVWATNFIQHVKPGHIINNHSKECFIKKIKSLLKPGGTIVCASDQISDIKLLGRHFKAVSVFSRFKHIGFKTHTQTRHEQNLTVVEIKD